MIALTSPSNPKIRQLRALRQRKGREETGLFIVEGIRHVGEAIEAGAKLAYLCYAPELLTSEFARQMVETQSAGGLQTYALSAEHFVSLADKENPQGVIAVVHRPQWTLARLTPQQAPWIVALSAAQDPGNIGAILRTIDAVGASGLLLLDDDDPDHRCADPFQPGAVRASMGTIFWRPVVTTNFTEFAAWARRNSYHIYGTSAHGSVPYEQWSVYHYPAVVLMGSERQGLSFEQTAVCEALIRLPMLGRATSLNLAVATGVILYDMLGKR